MEAIAGVVQEEWDGLTRRYIDAMVPELKSGELMEYLVGLIPALAVSAWSILIGFDKDRAFYPTVLIVITSYCGLFAVMGGSVQALLFESIAIGAFSDCRHSASSAACGRL